MKKLFFTFIALLIVFFSAWGIKLRMPINRPNNVQGEQQVAWYETRYTAPTAEEEWTLDPEIPVHQILPWCQILQQSHSSLIYHSPDQQKVICRSERAK